MLRSHCFLSGILALIVFDDSEGENISSCAWSEFWVDFESRLSSRNDSILSLETDFF